MSKYGHTRAAEHDLTRERVPGVYERIEQERQERAVRDKPVLLRMLREAKPVAVRVRAFYKVPVPSCHQIVDELRADGFVITMVHVGKDKDAAWRLDHDPEAEPLF